MDRVNTAVNENTLRHRTHRVADIPRDITSRHIRRTDVSVSDKFDRSHEIEHFNNYSKNGILVNDIGTSKCNNGIQSTEKLIIDMRWQEGDTYYEHATRFINNYPKDENNDWEIKKVFYDENGNPTTTHKIPPEELRIVTIYNGPLAVRYEVIITSVSYNKDGIRGGYSGSPADSVKKAEDSRLLRSEMDRLKALASQGTKDYTDGKINACDVSDIIETIYKDLLSLSIALGNTDGNDPKINAEILTSAQGLFAWEAVTTSYVSNFEEGFVYAKENYGKTMPGNDTWVYYNAKYFHANKELQDIARAATTRIANENGLEFNAEDIHNLRSTTIPPYCFNSMWKVGETSVRLKELDAEPPKDFIMFFTPTRYNYADWKNGERVEIFADDPNTPGGRNAISYWLKVPKGWQLFKSVPLWATQGKNTNQDGETFVNWDVSKHLNWQSGKDISTLLKEFFAEFINNPYHGDLVIWSNGTKSDHDVLFCIFDDKRKFDGSEMTAAVQHNEYVKNFEFRVF